MKLFLFNFAFFVVVTTASFSQTPSSCVPSSRFDSSYSDDVKDLALQRIYMLHNSDTSSITIPLAYQDTILDGMAAICNLDSMVDADSIFRKYCIHLFPYGYIMTSLSVHVDTSLPWAMQWRHMRDTTGYAPIDNFMERYGFRLTSYDTISWDEDLNNTAIIVTHEAVNTKAFADSLALFAGVAFTYFNPNAGDHNYITYQVDTIKHYNFRLGYGDCPSGCTSEEIWKYEVDDSCNVTFLFAVIDGTDPYPAPLNCNLEPPSGIPTVNNQLTLNAYPNPTNNVLHLNIIGTEALYSFEIYDMYGTEMEHGVASNMTDMNMETWHTGVYLLRVTDKNGFQTAIKIVKTSE